MPFVGFILIAMALVSVGTVVFMVMREHAEPEEWYDPAADKTLHRNTEPDSTSVAEVVGTQTISPSPVIDAEAKRKADESQT